MKQAILTLTDNAGNTKDNNGNAYGFFLSSEKALCEAYCKENNLRYKKTYITIEG